MLSFQWWHLPSLCSLLSLTHGCSNDLQHRRTGQESPTPLFLMCPSWGTEVHSFIHPENVKIRPKSKSFKVLNLELMDPWLFMDGHQRGSVYVLHILRDRSIYFTNFSKEQGRHLGSVDWASLNHDAFLCLNQDPATRKALGMMS